MNIKKQLKALDRRINAGEAKQAGLAAERLAIIKTLDKVEGRASKLDSKMDRLHERHSDLMDVWEQRPLKGKAKRKAEKKAAKRGRPALPKSPGVYDTTARVDKSEPLTPRDVAEVGDRFPIAVDIVDGKAVVTDVGTRLPDEDIHEAVDAVPGIFDNPVNHEDERPEAADGSER